MPVRERDGLNGSGRTTRQGPARPKSSAAHDLTGMHSTVLDLQRLAGNHAVSSLLRRQKGAAPTPVQRRLKWDESNRWAAAKHLDASRGGGGGVLFVGEDKLMEVVVKPGEDMATEGALAALLHGEAGEQGPKINGKAISGAPGLRVAARTEAQQIKRALTPLLPNAGSSAKNDADKAFQKDRAGKLVAALDQPGVVIQDLGHGDEFGKVTKAVPKHTEKKLFGGRKLRKESPLRIFKDPRSIEALGRTTAVDLFTGNKDRLLMFNTQNFMVTGRSVTSIDNIWMGTDASYFKTSLVQGRGGKTFTVTADEGMRTWKGDAHTKALAAGNYGVIAQKVWENILQYAASDTRGTDKKAFDQVMAGYKDRFMRSFTVGLDKGKTQLIVSLDQILQNPDRLQRLVPGADLDEVTQTIRLRRDFLMGLGV